MGFGSQTAFSQNLWSSNLQLKKKYIMEASIVFLLSFSVIALSSLLLNFVIRSQTTIKNLPPGSDGRPLIGETIDLLCTAKNGMPESFFHKRNGKRNNSQVFKTSLLGRKTAVMCGSAGNKFLCSSENDLVVGSWPLSVTKLMPSSIMAANGEDYERIRRLLMTSLRPDDLQRYVGRMDALTQQHIKTEWEGKGSITVLPVVKAYTFSLGCGLFLSVEDAHRVSEMGNHFGEFLEGIFTLAVAVPGTRFWRALRATDAIRESVKGIVAERITAVVDGRAEAEQDMLSHLLAARDAEGRMLNEREVLDNALVLLFGSEAATSCALSFLMEYLAQSYDVHQKVLEEQQEIARTKGPGELLTWNDVLKMKYSWNVVREVLRIASPVQGGLREAIAPISYAGFDIPKGWKLYWNTNTAHKNPDYFPEPDKFDPSRFGGNGPAPFEETREQL